jgi:drug/metabolite transporter (DMT)-like permease
MLAETTNTRPTGKLTIASTFEMVVGLALFSAFLYAVASVMQQRAARSAPDDMSLRVALVVHLLGRRTWLLGIAADVAAFACEFVALGRGSIVVVQPLLVCGLLFALPLGAALTRDRFRTADWVGTSAIVSGLALFLIAGSPAPGTPDASPAAWTVVAALTLGPAMACLAAARHRPSNRRASLLATAAGMIYGLSAALTKTVSHALDRGLLHLLASWPAYALVVAGVGGMVIAQSAFQAGSLAASLPMLTISNLLAGVAVGAAAFHERLRSSAPALVAETAGLALVVAGVFALARSPLVAAVHQAPQPAGAR